MEEAHAWGLGVLAAVSAVFAFLICDMCYREARCISACELAHGKSRGGCLWTLDRDLCLCGSGDNRQVICLDDDGCTGVRP